MVYEEYITNIIKPFISKSILRLWANSICRAIHTLIWRTWLHGLARYLGHQPDCPGLRRAAPSFCYFFSWCTEWNCTEPVKEARCVFVFSVVWYLCPVSHTHWQPWEASACHSAFREVYKSMALLKAVLFVSERQHLQAQEPPLPPFQLPMMSLCDKKLLPCTATWPPWLGRRATQTETWPSLRDTFDLRKASLPRDFLPNYLL